MKLKLTTTKLHHLTDLHSLKASTINDILDTADTLREQCIDKHCCLDTLAGKVVTHLFFEPSTRTRNSFEIAAYRSGAIVLSPDMKFSATLKGESLIDTINTFEALGTDIFVIRHQDNNTAQFVANELQSHASVLNAGDGCNQHPTQALLDLMTIRRHKKSFENLTVAIVGDIVHSRVANSLVDGLQLMGTYAIRLIGPSNLLPEKTAHKNITTHTELTEGLADADVIVALRIQKERMENTNIPNFEQYFAEYGITEQRLELAAKDAIVMHPGPMNRGVEITSDVADGPQSVILEQVTNGVAVRMAVLNMLVQ